ncbi:DUF1549 domain-containing protein [Calycomorphotria hydatis]|uniref:Translocation protein TolB n=1 Tax=Calycomorphotria hydatis TaxID=2528027 RepID=A0A517T446_9PLAN|nr:DUF1549 domain-containing protein [Calycomorphotria hydatis]QDT63142.1 translocation protein TolB [Calycomorphotria hydatis]
MKLLVDHFSACLVLFAVAACCPAILLAEDAENLAPVSFYNDVMPVFRTHCQGCHQPAHHDGEYIMTSVAELMTAGESGEAAIVPGKPDESYLISQITPVDGAAAMPKDGKPLAETELALIRRWVAEGAKDDTPASAHRVFNATNPPVYSGPPTLTAIEYSPDGSLLAVSGYHEVLLVNAEDQSLAGRLIGLSERIESVSFSPDGTKLAVAGGQPGRVGEIQIWDVAAKELILSHTVTFDTLYGASWSPDGKLVAFGCGDNTLRAIDAETGEQVLFQGAHEDWVRDTIFNQDGKHIVSVGRDMSCKLTEVETERFIDNVTSITPGALGGGINTVALHPKRDEIVVGGADGIVKTYRIFRITKRVIGDDANLIRTFPAMTGRTYGAAFSPDGKTIAAVSSLDGNGQLHLYDYPVDGVMPEDVKKIVTKRVNQWSPAEKKRIEEYNTEGVSLLTSVDVPGGGLFSLDFHPSGNSVAVGGSDGVVRVFEVPSGILRTQFSPAPAASDDELTQRNVALTGYDPVQGLQPESLPQGKKLTSLEVIPKQVAINSPFDVAQLIVQGQFEDGSTMDCTRMVQSKWSQGVAAMSPSGLISPSQNGSAELTLTLGDVNTVAHVEVSNLDQQFHVDFVRDVNPALSRLGCNQGTCHGAQKGKNGFKLSLRGYDPIFDVRALTDDLASRRVNPASPDDSLMLLKPIGVVPHVGGTLMKEGHPYYELLRNWIASGASLDLSTPRVSSIQIEPSNPVIPSIGARQQMRIVATYEDGSTRDVTRQAFIESGNTEVATADQSGLITSVRRGEAPVLARFEGAYVATTLTVMGDRSGFVWQDAPSWGTVDDLVAKKWQRMKIQPSGLCTDAEYIRRVYLDLTGLPPSGEEVREFLADQRDTKVKREALVDRLIGSDQYLDYWTNKWADLLQVNRKYLEKEGAKAFHDWIRNELAVNTPYDEFARKILTAEGSNKENPAASYYKIHRTPEETVENTTHLFLAIRFNCNKCHDHPFERWTQDQYYETAAYFAQVGLKRDPESGNRKIGGSAVEGATPLYEIVYDQSEGDVKHGRTGETAAPVFPFECDYDSPEKATRREKLASWMTSPDNPYFAKSYVNRMWGYLLGTGLIEPLDDIRAGNPPTNPELLDYLEQEFIQSDFDIRHLVRLICTSRTYQLSLSTSPWNEDDTLNYSHAKAKRLPAEVLFDTIYTVTGATPKIPGVEPGTRAAQLPDAGIKLKDGFLANLGRPSRESACECERSNELQLGPVMALVSGPTVADAIGDGKNALPQLVKDHLDDRELVNELFLRVLSRPATAGEIDAVLQSQEVIPEDHATLAEQLKEREAWWVENQPKQEQARLDAIKKAEEKLAAYEAEIAPEREKLAKEREEKIAAADKELKDQEAKLPELIAEFEKSLDTLTEWFPLTPSTLKASADIKLSLQDDRSIKAEGDADKSTYTIEFPTSITGITGVRLEALGDAASSPGLAGNFVVSELQMAIRPTKDGKYEDVKLVNPVADFEQSGYPVKEALDGDRNPNNNGWAVSPSVKTSHWATFETKQAIGHEDGSVIRLIIIQNHNAKKHLLSRFRISVTRKASPIGLSTTEEFASILSTPADQRTEAAKQFESSYVNSSNKKLVELRDKLNTAKKALPEDSGVTKRKKYLALVSRPVPLDSKLARLRSDMEQSQSQMQNRRLTLAQDVTWALINNPAFLFNR